MKTEPSLSGENAAPAGDVKTVAAEGSHAAAGSAAAKGAAPETEHRKKKVARARRQTPRQRWLATLFVVVAIAGIGWGAWWLWTQRYDESTDDAYVSGNVVQITPQIAGTVIAIGADDTQFVDAGYALVKLDPADEKVALDRAEADLAKTVRDVRSLFATNAQLEAAVAIRESDLARANDDFARRERLVSSGAISGEELQHARDAVTSAKAALLAAQQQLAANRARTDNTTIEDHPDVRSAAAQVRAAYLAFARTTLPAPVSGFVAKRAVQLGQRVAPGTPLMAIVPLEAPWVDANFKESQLAHMRVGQPVTLKADLYGGRVVYHGKVAGFGAGTGSAFALLPAQNATGNWIKVVQRVPVRIEIDQAELAKHPLQIGLSMEVDVDTRDRSGPRLPMLAQRDSHDTTTVFDAQETKADARVKAIIAANESAAGAAAVAKRGGAASQGSRVAKQPGHAAREAALHRGRRA
ncbi:MAG: efflux RND transporter periplasmic adaptor subunit [Proteobacteria bacterium]|jgi:membrane fusion protein (multidrug efflux system)|nr:efflux RND transporter periplasmic adaptor subunit [Pseudomonadota bacterium]